MITQNRSNSAEELPAGEGGELREAFAIKPMGKIKAAFGKGEAGAKALNEGDTGRNRHHVKGISNKAIAGNMKEGIGTAEGEEGGKKADDGEFGDELLGGVEGNEGNGGHADVGGNEGEAEDPQAGVDTGGVNDEVVLNAPRADGVADEDEEGGKNEVDTEGGVEPFFNGIDLLLPGFIMGGLADGVGVVATDAAGHDAVEEGDEDDNGADEAEEAEIILAEGFEDPTATE